MDRRYSYKIKSRNSHTYGTLYRLYHAPWWAPWFWLSLGTYETENIAKNAALRAAERRVRQATFEPTTTDLGKLP